MILDIYDCNIDSSNFGKGLVKFNFLLSFLIPGVTRGPNEALAEVRFLKEDPDMAKASALISLDFLVVQYLFVIYLCNY